MAGNLGTRSFIKFGTTHPWQCGCIKNDVNVRARWIWKKRQQDVYADVTLPWPDVKVASKLCIGGPC
eukprot:13992225-Ditylum_brightwellii.AAC.1